MRKKGHSKSFNKEQSMCLCKIYFKKEEHSHDLKGRADLADGLDLVPFIGDKVGPPDADWSGVTFWLPSC